MASMESAALLEAEAKCRGVRALVSAIAAGLVMVVMAGWAYAERERIARILELGRAGKLEATPADFERQLHLVMVLGLALVLYVAAGVVPVIHQLVEAYRWRGMEVRITANGVTIGRPPVVRHIGWQQIRRVPSVPGELAITTNEGETFAVPLLPLDETRLRAGNDIKAWHPAAWLPLVGRAYHVAVRRGLPKATAEPPVLYMRPVEPRRSGKGSGVAWAILALLVAASGTTVASMPVAAARWMSPAEVTGLVVGMTVVVAVLLWEFWSGVRGARKRIVRADRRGLMFQDAKERRFLRWEEISEMSRSRRNPLRGVTVRAAGKRHEVLLTWVRYANLALLCRAEALREDLLLLAAWEYYKERRQ